MVASVTRDQVVAWLVSRGYDVTVAETAIELLDHVRRRPPQMLIAEHAFGSSEHEDWMTQLSEELPAVPVVSLPAGADGAAAAAGDNAAAEVPGSLRAVESLFSTPRGIHGSARRGGRKRGALDPFVGESAAIRELREQARKALASESPVLIEGETGSGKGVLAAWLHRHGPRRREAFIDLNCAGFSRELMDSELFGHERGAFTGAITAKPGLIEVADHGTLFLDEIGDMDPPIQAKLLKVIEEKRFRRIGETRERESDVRIIAATHQNLLQLVRDGRFREDLYYRIGVLSVRVPALRRRSADVPALARRIMCSLAQDLGLPEPAITPEAEQLLVDHAWPGNLRELRNELERAILAAGPDPIEPRHLALAILPVGVRDADLDGDTLEQLERAFIQRVLDEEQHVERAANRLGIPRSTFYQKLRALGISPRR